MLVQLAKEGKTRLNDSNDDENGWKLTYSLQMKKDMGSW